MGARRGRLRAGPAAHGGAGAGDAKDHRPLPHEPAGRRAAVAHARADGRQAAAVPLFAGAGHPHADVDSHAGLARHPPDVRRAHHRARGAHGRDERGHADAAGRAGAGRTGVPLPAGHARAAVPHCARRGRPGVSRHGAAHGRVDGAVRAGPRRVRAGGAGALRGRRRGAVRALPLGAVRRAGAAAVVPLRRDGEPAPDLRHAHHPGRRPLAGVARRARAGALVDRQPGHQRDLVGLLAQRGVHHLLREPDHGGAVRPGARRHAGEPGLAAPADGHRGRGRNERRRHAPAHRPGGTRPRRGDDGDPVREGRHLPAHDRRGRGRDRAGTRTCARTSTATRSGP